MRAGPRAGQSGEHDGTNRSGIAHALAAHERHIGQGTWIAHFNVQDRPARPVSASTARALARQYCEKVKDADADLIIIVPRAPGEPGIIPFILEEKLEPQCTRTHSLICKQRMADLVAADSYCRRLYEEGFSFDYRDEFTRATTPSDSRSLYQELQRQGCRLH